jgi:hypothetical protein
MGPLASSFGQAFLGWGLDSGTSQLPRSQPTA